jgi:hypothetical protein
MPKLYPMPSESGSNTAGLYVAFDPGAPVVAAFDALPPNASTNSSAAGPTSQGEPEDRLLTLMHQVRGSMAAKDWEEFSALLSKRLAGPQMGADDEDDDALADKADLLDNASLKTNPRPDFGLIDSNTRAAQVGPGGPKNSGSETRPYVPSLKSQRELLIATDAYRRQLKAQAVALEAKRAVAFDIANRRERRAQYPGMFPGSEKIGQDSRYGEPVAPKPIKHSAAQSYAEMFPGATRIKQAL